MPKGPNASHLAILNDSDAKPGQLLLFNLFLNDLVNCFDKGRRFNNLRLRP